MSAETSPNIPQKEPYAIELEAGTYWWCSCGNSSNQPWCDGSHKGSNFAPQRLDVEKNKTLYLCGCKHSSKSPFCDGSHNKL